MRITDVTIRNYRSLKDVSIQLDNYGVFIGANGSGKSSVLYALDWFFNATPLTEADIHGCEENGTVEPGATIEVAVTFSDLTDKDRERLQQYGRADRVKIRRTWYADSKQTKIVGNTKQGPGFAKVREESQGIADRRRAYRNLRETVCNLPELRGNASKDTIISALAEWESNPDHSSLLIEVPDSDATQMMGWNGSNVIRECVRFVFIPAATSIAGEVGASTRGTALTELVGAFMAEASVQAQENWIKRNAAALSELTSNVRTSIEHATEVQARRINDRLTTLIPNANVSLMPVVPDFVPQLNPSIATTVTIAGFANDVSRQGHGVQRAVMISMFQAMVPDEDLTRKTHEAHAGEDEATSQARLTESIDALPNIVVAIEEPEIYQHPVRARAFAKTLTELSDRANAQVLLATHSPYFIQPEQFGALHRFTLADGETSIANATIESISNASGLDKASIEKAILSHVPTEFSEGFFADAVVLVEGQTDRIVLEALSEKIGSDLDHLGVTVLSVSGKRGLPVTRAILSTLGVPTYVLIDGDFGTANRKPYPNLDETAARKKIATAHASNRAATEDLIAALPATPHASIGSLPYNFGDASVVSDKFTIWKDDIEEELGSWVSFVEALSSAGITLASRNNKNLLVYRNAVRIATESDMPNILKVVMDQIISISRGLESTEPRIIGE